MTDLKIQKNDLLSIQIASATLDPTADMIFNQVQAGQGGQGGGAAAQTFGYLVDLHGNIELPRLGPFHAEGMTKKELETAVKAKLKDKLTDPTVTIRFLNFRITVLGQVNAPGVITVQSERLTIIEAVGLAGGINEYGTIQHVRVLREKDGVRESGVLDLTSKSIFENKFYQLEQNDVVLVDQTEYKQNQSRADNNLRIFTTAISIFSAIVLVISVFRR